MTDSNPPDDDPFAEFEDWLIDGPAGRWPTFGIDATSFEQAKIARDNFELIQDHEAWNRRVFRFEDALESIKNPDLKKRQRSKYQIRFDGCDFGSLMLPNQPRGIRFPCSLVFWRCNFSSGETRFEGCFFQDSIYVERVIMNGQILSDTPILNETSLSFRGSVINGSLIIIRSKINKSTLNFSECKFISGHLIVSSNRFNDVSFIGSDAHIEKDLRLSGNQFEHGFFDNMVVGGQAKFDRTRFRNLPSFRNAKFEQSPEVARMSIPKPGLISTRKYIYSWPVPHDYERNLLFKRAGRDDDVLKLRKLKAMAIAANDHEKDGEFFAYEMMAKRGTEHTTFWQLLFNTIYWKVSFYGQSYLRPLGWLAGSFATFAAIYSLMAALPIGGWQSLAFGIAYSFKNSLPFLGTLTRSVPSPEGHVSWFALQLQAIKDAQPGPDWFTVLGTGQAMLSLFFFFFLLLGLRNKFRLK